MDRLSKLENTMYVVWKVETMWLAFQLPIRWNLPKKRKTYFNKHIIVSHRFGRV
jgi:hypothetical protein